MNEGIKGYATCEIPFGILQIMKDTIEDHIARIVLNRLEARNAITQEMVEHL